MFNKKMLHEYVAVVDAMPPGIHLGTRIHDRYRDAMYAADRPCAIGRNTSYQILEILGYQRSWIGSRSAFLLDIQQPVTDALLRWADDNEKRYRKLRDE